MTSSFPLALKAFLVEFLKHIAHEDELLRPVLVQVDGLGAPARRVARP